MRALLLACVMLVVVSGTVAAHAELLESFPAPGQRFRGGDLPARIELTFSQRLVAAEIRVTDAGFRVVRTGETEIDDENPRVARASLPPLGEGRYIVGYRSESVDGHAFDGSYEFDVVATNPAAAWLTRIVAVVVFGAMGLLVWFRRARD